MINTLLGIKKGMTSTYDARGRRVGATVLEVSSSVVTQIKQADGPDGYGAIQLGFGAKKNVNKPQKGIFKKIGASENTRWLREVRTEDQDMKLGQKVSLGDVFSVGDSVKVSGTSKGRGFAGGVKRYGFAGGPKTHGQSDRHRAPGSIGQTTTPGRVYRGKRMAGHMGVETVSVRNLEVVKIDKKNNLLTVKGGVPGPVGGLITISKLGRIKGYTPPPEEKEEEEEDIKQEGSVDTKQEDVVAEQTEQIEKKGEE